MVIEVLICSIGMASNRTSKSSSVLRSEEHTSELQSQSNLVCRLLLEKKKKTNELQSQSKLLWLLLLEKKNEIESQASVIRRVKLQNQAIMHGTLLEHTRQMCEDRYEL